MKTTDYEELLTEIENEYWNQNISVSDFYILFGHKIRTFREAQQKLISDPIEFAKKVCELSGCKYADLKIRTRKIEVVRAKQLILVSWVNVFRMNIEIASDSFGNNRCMYYHSKKTVNNDFRTDKQYRLMFDSIFNNYPQIIKS
jgi:hypothetical protein